MDIGKIRKEFTKGGLELEDLNDDPFLQFERWFKEAMKGELIEPNAFVLSTVSAAGIPSTRTVLLKFFDKRGFVFYTNYNSRKAQELAENPYAAVLFPWLALERQVKIIGKTVKVSTAESLKYFSSRPRGSQLGAWVSHQSSVITSRSLLMQKYEEIKHKFANREVPIPSFWGGYRIIPEKFEFWQGRQNRLHDRFEYTLVDEKWEIRRLAP